MLWRVRRLAALAHVRASRTGYPASSVLKNTWIPDLNSKMFDQIEMLSRLNVEIVGAPKERWF